MQQNKEIQPHDFDAKTIKPYYGESDANLVNSPLVREIASEILKQEGRVLDIGCGFGTFYSLLTSNVEYHGVDITLAKDAIDQSQGGRFRLQWADCCEPLPFHSESYDSVVSFWCLEHVAKPRVMLSEMVRVLKPGGKLYLVFPNYDNPLRRCPSYWCDLAEDDSIRSLRKDLKLTRIFRQLFRRTTYFVRQWSKQVLLDFLPMALFEINEDPAYKHMPWARDRDAIHIVSGRSVIRFLTDKGLFLQRSNNREWSSRIPFLGSFFRREAEYSIFLVKRWSAK